MTDITYTNAASYPTYREAISYGWSQACDDMKNISALAAECGFPQKPLLKLYMEQRLRLIFAYRQRVKAGDHSRALAVKLHHAEGEAAAAYYHGHEFFFTNPPHIEYTRYMVVALLPVYTPSPITLA